MSAELQSYRLLNRLDLSPSFTSLGLRPDLFRDGGDADATSFDAALSGPGDILWLFRGEDFLGYDLRQNRIAVPLSPIAPNWCGGNLPAAFSVGMDSATWAGPGFPNLAYLFRGGDFIRLDCSVDPASPLTWTITLDPFPTNNEWLRLPSPDGVPRIGPMLEPCAKLYGLREDANRIHFFTRDGKYARHNLNNGEYDIAPTDTVSRFPLPERFNGRVDIAFYGAGAEAEHIFFFCRNDYAEIDIRRNALVRSGAIEQRFPALGTLLARPQLFLVEDYALDTYVGPLTLGRLISTLQVPPQSKLTRIMETRIVAPSAMALRQNLIEGAAPSAVADFYARLASSTPEADASGSLVGANGIWVGEVDALSDSEPLDARRDALVDAAFTALAEQARQSTHQIDQRLVDPVSSTATGETLNRETFELTNTSDRMRQVEFMELMQSYATLMLLKNVRLAYSNGRDRPMQFALREIDGRLADLLVDQASARAIIAYLKQQLARIQDSSGEMRSFLLAGAELDVDARVKTGFVIDDITPPQTLQMFGIVKATRSWRQPTYQTRALNWEQDTASELVAEISPVSVQAEAEIAPLIEAVGAQL